MPRYRTQHMVRVPAERVEHIIRHLTCPCGYTAMDLLLAGRTDEIQLVLPDLAPGTRDDGKPAQRVRQMHTVCQRWFQWDEVIPAEPGGEFLLVEVPEGLRNP